MPAVITHDLFAKDLYNEVFESVGGSRDEAEAFLLGNQGPDPLFYIGADPRYLSVRSLASLLHRERPAAFIVALKESVRDLPPAERSVGRAYALGFVGHYELDRTLHPFILAQVNAICGVGVEGLSQEDKSEVHAAIETELDELVLTAKRGETVATFNPATATLKGTESMLDTVSRLYALAVRRACDLAIPAGMFKSAVHANRAANAALYSPSGVKRTLIGAAERLVRAHSMAQALSHRAEERHTSVFANEDHTPWAHPSLPATSTASFWDLYDQALQSALDAIAAVDDDGFTLEGAERITEGLNFYGEPVVALIMAVEDANPEDTPQAPAPMDDAEAPYVAAEPDDGTEA